MNGHPHPRDAVDDLTARFTPLAELAALIAMADEQQVYLDVRPPIDPDIARSIAKIADDIAVVAAALDAYSQEAASERPWPRS
jgi:hypothetical protein